MKARKTFYWVVCPVLITCPKLGVAEEALRFSINKLCSTKKHVVWKALVQRFMVMLKKKTALISPCLCLFQWPFPQHWHCFYQPDCPHRSLKHLLQNNVELLSRLAHHVTVLRRSKTTKMCSPNERFQQTKRQFETCNGVAMVVSRQVPDFKGFETTFIYKSHTFSLF